MVSPTKVSISAGRGLRESNIYISGKAGFSVKQYRLPSDNHVREVVFVKAQAYF